MSAAPSMVNRCLIKIFNAAEINDIKKQQVSKLKIALGKTKYDGMKRYDAEVRRLKDEHKKELDQKDEQMQILTAKRKKSLFRFNKWRSCRWN